MTDTKKETNMTTTDDTVRQWLHPNSADNPDIETGAVWLVAVKSKQGITNIRPAIVVAPYEGGEWSVMSVTSNGGSPDHALGGRKTVEEWETIGLDRPAFYWGPRLLVLPRHDFAHHIGFATVRVLKDIADIISADKWACRLLRDVALDLDSGRR